MLILHFNIAQGKGKPDEKKKYEREQEIIELKVVLDELKVRLFFLKNVIF